MRRAVLTVVVALVLTGCGSLAAIQKQEKAHHRKTAIAAVPVAHPQVVDPVAGVAADDGSQPADVSVGVSGSAALQQPVSLDSVKQELAESGVGADQNKATLTAGGLAIPPLNAPQAVVEMIDAGNEIAHLKYRFGGGHGTFIDTAYDCSGSLSFILANAGLLNTTVTSGQLMSMYKPGPGKWVTIFATNGHTFAYIAGLRFDTVALAETGSRWSNRPADEPDRNQFVARHPAGL